MLDLAGMLLGDDLECHAAEMDTSKISAHMWHMYKVRLGVICHCYMLMFDADHMSLALDRQAHCNTIICWEEEYEVNDSPERNGI